MPTIVTQLETKCQEVTSCEEKLDKLERRMRLHDLTEQERNSLQLEESSLKKKLKEYEKEVSDLRKENGKNSFISFAILIFIVIVFYFIYPNNELFDPL